MSGLHCDMRDLDSHGMWELVPWPGIKPGPAALGIWHLSHWITGEAPGIFFVGRYLTAGSIPLLMW